MKFSSQKGIQGARTREIGAQASYFCSMATNQQGFDAGKAALEQNLGILEEEMVRASCVMKTCCCTLDSGDDKAFHAGAGRGIDDCHRGCLFISFERAPLLRLRGGDTKDVEGQMREWQSAMTMDASKCSTMTRLGHNAL